VRSPHAHARITRIDCARALELPGVLAVLTAQDAPELGAAVPPLIREPAWPAYHHPLLARERVRHVGEAVAVVVAEDAYRAADGAEAVRVEYEPLPVAVATTGAPAVVHDGWRDNLAGVNESVVGDVSAGLAAAEAVVAARLTYPRVTGVPIETRGVVAVADAQSGRLTVWSSTQVPFGVRSAVAAALGLPEEMVRVIAPDVGGGFGIKGHVYPEDILVPAVATRLGRPVKWIETRREHFLTASADRDQAHDARMGVRRDGAVTALETTFTRDHGAYPTLGGAITENTINHLVGPYRIPSYRARGRNVVTHKSFAAAYRGAGRPEAAYLVERLVDVAARETGIDPAELRRRNYLPPNVFPYTTSANCELAPEPSEFAMRGSHSRAARSARRASATRASTATARSAGSKSARSSGAAPKPSSGRPAHGSGAVAPARATASAAMRSMDPGARSLVETTAERRPPGPATKARIPRVRSRAWVTKSSSGPPMKAALFLTMCPQREDRGRCSARSAAPTTFFPR